MSDKGWAMYDGEGRCVAVSPFGPVEVMMDVAGQEGIELPGIDGSTDLDTDRLEEILKAKGFTEAEVQIVRSQDTRPVCWEYHEAVCDCPSRRKSNESSTPVATTEGRMRTHHCGTEYMEGLMCPTCFGPKSGPGKCYGE